MNDLLGILAALLVFGAIFYVAHVFARGVSALSKGIGMIIKDRRERDYDNHGDE